MTPAPRSGEEEYAFLTRNNQPFTSSQVAKIIKKLEEIPATQFRKGGAAKMITCVHCLLEFRRPSKLRRHIKRSYQGAFLCPKCTYPAPAHRRDQLKTHFKESHPGVKIPRWMDRERPAEDHIDPLETYNWAEEPRLDADRQDGKTNSGDVAALQIELEKLKDQNKRLLQENVTLKVKAQTAS